MWPVTRMSHGFHAARVVSTGRLGGPVWHESVTDIFTRTYVYTSPVSWTSWLKTRIVDDGLSWWATSQIPLIQWESRSETTRPLTQSINVCWNAETEYRAVRHNRVPFFGIISLENISRAWFFHPNRQRNQIWNFQKRNLIGWNALSLFVTGLITSLLSAVPWVVILITCWRFCRTIAKKKKKRNLTVCQVVSAVIAFDLSGVPRPTTRHDTTRWCVSVFFF